MFYPEQHFNSVKRHACAAENICRLPLLLIIMVLVAGQSFTMLFGYKQTHVLIQGK